MRVLLEGELESEQILSTMLISDNKNATYPVDFTKFLNTITGAAGVGPGAGLGAGQMGTGTVGGAGGGSAYY